MIYKLSSCLTSTSQVGHVTCDNASNNLTMLRELAMHIDAATEKKYKWQQKKIKYVLC
jgi:hypothetical protein